MDGEKVKIAARYVGTGTIIRSVETARHLSEGLEKEAAIAGKAVEFGKRIAKGAFTLPKTLPGAAMKRLGRVREGLVGTQAGAETFGRRVMNPGKGVGEGWKDMSGVAGRQRQVEDMTKRVAEGGGAKASDALRKYMDKTKHLDPNAKPTGIFDRLSRGGWTGEGDLAKITKYLPVGSKGMVTGFGAMEIPGIVNAQKATPTGEGGRLERLGGLLGGSAGWVAGSGRMGILPAMALWYAGSKAGTKAGRVADRLRSGGTMGQAFTAPSPEEAREQLSKIYQTYGG